MLDDIFGNKSRVDREFFLDCIVNKTKYMFSPEELRVKMLEQNEIAGE